MKKKNLALFSFLLVCIMVFSNFLFPLSKVSGADYMSVSISPNTVNVQNSYTITLKFDSLDISPNTTFEIGFDEGDAQSSMVNIPAAVSPVYIKIQYVAASYPASSAQISPVYTLTGKTAYRLKFSIANSNISIPRGSTFSIVIDKSANIYPKQAGSHSIFVMASGYMVSSTYSVGTSSSTSITINSVNILNQKLGEMSGYTFNFSASQTLVTGDIIYVEFPADFLVPNLINGINISLVQGSYQIPTFEGNVTVSSHTVALKIPSTAYTFTGGNVVFGPYTGIINPNTYGQYTFKMYTSRQTVPATYVVTLGTSVSNLIWNIAPNIENAYSENTISFNTSKTGALTTTDTVTIQFPKAFVIPAQIPQGCITFNNTVVTKVTSSSNSIVIGCPVAVNSLSAVSIKITTDAKIQNPTASQTGYKIKVFTSEDNLPLDSNAIIIAPSVLQNVSVYLNPPMVSKPSAVAIQFTTGLGGALSPNDTINILFPIQFILPNQISNNLVSIIYNDKTYNPSSVSVAKQTGTVVLTLPANLNIVAGSVIKVIFDVNANITNPATPGTLTIRVSTSKETTSVESNQFEILAYPKSSINISPSMPDGTNGYYITQPAFTLSVPDIPGVTVTLYYKVGDNDTYKTYDLSKKPSIQIPGGKTTVYFYATDNFGDKEPENSKTFLVDLSDPEITIVSPEENSVIVQPSFTLKGTVKAFDITQTTLSIGDKAVQLGSDGSFEALVSVSAEGINTFVIVAKSASGRTATKQFSVNYIARVTLFLQVGNNKAYINGEPVQIDAAPFITNGNVMVPLRFILTSFKATLDWDGIFQIITLILSDTKIRLQVGNLRADVNGQLKMLPVAPILVKNITFVPLRFISENFGAEVEWDSNLKAVSIVYPKL